LFSYYQGKPGCNKKGEAYKAIHGKKRKLYPGQVTGIYHKMLVKKSTAGENYADVIKKIQAAENPGQ